MVSVRVTLVVRSGQIIAMVRAVIRYRDSGTITLTMHSGRSVRD